MRSPRPPLAFMVSLARYETWMREALGGLLVEDDLRFKHRRMHKDPFLFLRGTCWRWAELANGCDILGDGPQVASVGDAHVGNFGLWRDAEGRLVWGVNDFDEAAVLPYRMDLTRLVTSATIARGDAGVDEDLTGAALDGYAAGLADPRPCVLEQDHIWLRKLFAATNRERTDFWAKLRRATPEDDIPEDYRRALLAALPAVAGNPVFSRRRAGVGSLGRPRIVVLADDSGGPIAREAKALLPSCWNEAQPAGKWFSLGSGRCRSPDPFMHLADDIILRRLGPNSRRIDLNAHKRRVRRKLIEAMARDIGSIHARDGTIGEAIRTHLGKHGRGWLARSVETMRSATLEDWHAFRDATDRRGRSLASG